MLVLSRQRNEIIKIGDEIDIIIVDIRGDKVRLGIVAPKNIPIHRKEVYDQISFENKFEEKIKDDVLSIRECSAEFKLKLIKILIRMSNSFDTIEWIISGKYAPDEILLKRALEHYEREI